MNSLSNIWNMEIFYLIFYSFPDFYMNLIIIERPYFPMPAFLSPPIVDMSQLFLQSGLPDDDDGDGPAALLPRRHINFSIGSERQRLPCAVDRTSRLQRL